MPKAAPRRALIPRARAWLTASAMLGVALHLALVAYFFGLRAVFGREPLSGDDFDVHAGQVFRVLEGLLHWGHAWVYDPKLLAGQPEGTIFDADNKGWELWTFGLVSLGVPRAIAFNTFILLGPLLCPLVIFVSARLFRLGAAASLLAAVMASSLWFFDSFAHWVWWIGMSSYAAASVFWLLPLAVFHRFLDGRRVGQAVACGALLGIAHLIHPYCFFMLIVPMAAMYLRSRQKLSLRDHLAVLTIPALTLAINGYWLLAAFQHWHYVLNSAYFGQTGVRYLVADFFSILINPTDTGVIGTRTGFRFLYLALAGAGLFVWRRERDLRLLPFASALGALMVLGYLGGHLPYCGQLQPYRFVLPLAFAATIPAGFSVAHAFGGGFLARAGRGTQAVIAIAALPGFQHLASDVAYFMPSLVPEVPALIDGLPSPINAYGYLSHFQPPPQHFLFALPRDPNVESQYDKLVDWVKAHVPSGHRILVDSTVLGERIAWKTDVEVMGGFRERNIAHGRANFFRRFGGQQVGETVIATYLKTFAIEYVIVHRAREDFDRARGALDSLGLVDGWQVYKTRFAVNTFLRGTGRLRASVNQLRVDATDPREDLLLSYHFHEALRCEPGCRIVNEAAPLDDVGLIRVPSPHPADFVIRNRY